MNNDEQKILQKHLQFVLCDVFNVPTQDDLLKIHSSHKWEYKGTELPEANVIELKTQAQKLLDSELWKIIKGGIQHDATQRALNKSQTESDIIGAKMEIYLLNEIEKILKHMTQ
jgi:hypothetical protein